MTTKPYNKYRRTDGYDYGKALAIFYDVVARHRIDAQSLRDGTSRWPHMTNARREFCQLAHAAKLSYQAIADAVGLDHTSVYWHVIDDGRRRNQNRVRAKAYRARRQLCRAA